MTDPRSATVTVGLDVHASSVVLAAVRGDELLEERTLPTDNEAAASTLARWPDARGEIHLTEPRPLTVRLVAGR